MRPAYLLPAAALLLGPAAARGEPPPRVAVHLDYQRGPGGAACPAEELLHDEVARRMGYDPFDPSAASRLVVVVALQSAPQARRFEAHVDRYAPGGEKTWSEVYPGGTRCALMFPSLASEISAVLEPAPPPLRTTLPPAAAPELPAVAPELVATQAPAAAAPELPAVQAPPPVRDRVAVPPEPSPAHRVAPSIAIASYAASAVFLGLAIAYTAETASKEAQASALNAQILRSGGSKACNPGGSESVATCKTLASAWQARDTSGNWRNVWYGLAGAAAAVGTILMVVAIEMPRESKRELTLSVGPGRFTIEGSF